MKNLTKDYSKLIFDMDGTLVDSISAVESAWKTWAKKHNVDVDKILSVAHGRPAKDVLCEISSELDIDSEIAHLIELELQNMDMVKAVPGASAFLSRLKKDSWAIFTSCPRDLAIRRLTAASIPIPEVLVTIEDVHHGKPNPEGYILAAEKLGVNTNQCLVFEDANAGVQSALKAGCDVIAVQSVAPDKIDITGVGFIEDYFDISISLQGKRIAIDKDAL